MNIFNSKMTQVAAVAVLAVSALSSAQAASFAAPTQANLTLGTTIIGVLGTATIVPLGGAAYTGTVLSEPFSSVDISGSGASFSLKASSPSTAGFAINTLASATAPAVSVGITGLSFDTSTKGLNAVLSVNGVQAYSGLFLQADSYNVVETFNAATGTGLLQTGDLKLTTASATALLSALNLPSFYVGILTPVAFGTLQVDVTGAAAAVPEPSTYALMGVGLLGMALVARKRRQA